MKPADGMSDTKRETVKQWFDNTLYTRLDSKRDDVIILVMQRLHIDDLVGHVLESGDWVHLDLPAIADEPQSIAIGDDEVHHRKIGDVLHADREPRETLEHIKETIGSQAFSAQYQQAPVPPGGGLIKKSWFRFYRDPPNRSGVRMVQSWDTASKADEIHDYSVCTTWLADGKDYYLIDVFRDRLEYPELKRRVIAEAQHHGAKTVLIEDSGSGTHLIQELQRGNAVRPIGCKPKGDKVTRMSAQSAKIEGGQVYLPERAPWLKDFLVEMMHFPHGRHDDQVDSVSQFLAWIDQGVVRRVVPVRA
jgi:predicted phage terminase large subunit-like protein